MSILQDPVRPLDPSSLQEFLEPGREAAAEGGGELLRTVEDARRHVQDLHGDPLLHQPTWALDLD